MSHRKRRNKKNTPGLSFESKGRKRGRKRISFRGAADDSSQKMFIRHGKKKISGDDIIGYMVSNGGEASQSEILEAFDLGRSHRKGLDLLLADLCNAKILFQSTGNNYSIKNSQDFKEAVLSVNPRGFAFASLAPPHDHLDDVFIAGRNTLTAMHGDRVLIKVSRRKGEKAEGRVLRILQRNTSHVVGIYKAGKPLGLVSPEDDRFPFNILVRREKSCGAKDGEAVVVAITEHSLMGVSNPKGDIVEVLGDPASLDVQTEIVIRKFMLPHRFSPDVSRQVDAIDDRIEKTDDRLDLRDVLHITIDGETARDFDDAVAVEKKGDLFILHVSIADVSHYVPSGTALDQEAYQRGTSVYFPTRVVPMLPERLSNDLCSLVPNKERYAFTAMLEFDSKGVLTNKKFNKSIIKSHYRMTYEKVWGIISGESPEMLEQYSELAPHLKDMEELARLLLATRTRRGSIGFELPEAFVDVDQEGKINNIQRRSRNFAHQIVEEFMLAANEAVAKSLADKNIKGGLFRIHERPDPIKVEEFGKFARTMGLELPESDCTPEWFGQVLKMAKGTPQEYIVNNLLLRTMKQARYTEENVGHFGLAATHYTHFTSPIRRYPDLLVHRALAAFLTGKSSKKKKNRKLSTDISEQKMSAGEFLSQRERLAVDAEREMVDRLKVCFMEDKVGDSFEALISGVSSFGLFVELLDSFISGGVAIKDLTDDYYYLDEANHRLVGKRHNKLYQIGKLVSVRLESVEKARRRLNFVFD